MSGLAATDVRSALYRRYNRPSQGRPGEQYVCLEEARSGAGFKGNDGQCDFLAIKDEIPPAWGLLSVSAKGRITELVSAPSRDPEPLPTWWWVGWLAQIDRQHKRTVPGLVEAALVDERDALAKRTESEIAERVRRKVAHIDRLQANVDLLRDAVGIDLNHVWSGDIKALGVAWRLAKDCPQLDTLATNLRRAADAIEATAHA